MRLQVSAAEVMAIVEVAKVTLRHTAVFFAVTPCVCVSLSSAAAVSLLVHARPLRRCCRLHAAHPPFPFAAGACSWAMEGHSLCCQCWRHCACSGPPVGRPCLREPDRQAVSALDASMCCALMPHCSCPFAFASPFVSSTGISPLPCIRLLEMDIWIQHNCSWV